MTTPSLLLIALVAVYPIIYAIWLSMHEYSLVQAGLSRWASPAGFGNYIDAFGDAEFRDAVVVTLIFTVGSVALETVIGLAMAMTMAMAFRGQGVLRTVVLVPWAVLTVVTAIMWRTMFDSNLGFVNTLIGTNTVWLGTEPQALLVMILADVWKTAPFMALLLLAGLQMLPQECYESARVDGVHPVKVFFKVTLPLLKPALMVAIIFRALDALRIFDLIYVMNGNNKDTMSMSVYARQQLVDFQDVGYGSAAATMVFLIIALFTIVYLMLVRVGEER